MSTIRDIMKNFTPKDFQEALLKRKMGKILEGHKNGWLTNDEAKKLLINAFENYTTWVDKNKE
ncbi:hypothetical protein PQE70_gp118 [Bacillus phage vB_BanS_Nate]|uniref:Uncharacterized protein n=1 Tax=Bacillus phage vB_BanS_Nate TaxID=2894788 RepID=A0AAE9CED0_9CAUD|nr:hypothetical protein PQE70_gp118 [Bacillus phage vB_BanS_Nate]UGO50971.1 hypothetical protein NATE_118 [Bacillus phage vB_BanS_Nate]